MKDDLAVIEGIVEQATADDVEAFGREFKEVFEDWVPKLKGTDPSEAKAAFFGMLFAVYIAYASDEVTVASFLLAVRRTERYFTALRCWYVIMFGIAKLKVSKIW